MDLVERALGFIAALPTPGPDLLADDARVEADGWHAPLTAEGFVAWCQDLASHRPRLEFMVDDAAQRRNLVLMQWRATWEDGGASGAAVLSFDQDGRVVHARFYWDPSTMR